jgi:antitoxin component YwqK of YwqJK toxin-antitoxin module
MKKIVLITAIGLLLTGCSNSSSPSKKSPWGTDNSRTISPKKNGVKNGVEKVYANNGTLIWSVPYVNGKMHGKKYFYSPTKNRKSTKLSHITDYKNGLADGHQIYYYDNGAVSVDYKYKNGKEHGKMLAYHRNGKVSQIAYYKNGKLDGPYKEYNKNGTLTLTLHYKNGRRTDVYDRHSFYWHQVEIDCKEFFTPTSVVFDGGGKIIHGKAARNLWYKNHCGKYIKK